MIDPLKVRKDRARRCHAMLYLPRPFLYIGCVLIWAYRRGTCELKVASPVDAPSTHRRLSCIHQCSPADTGKSGVEEVSENEVEAESCFCFVAKALLDLISGNFPSVYSEGTFTNYHPVSFLISGVLDLSGQWLFEMFHTVALVSQCSYGMNFGDIEIFSHIWVMKMVEELSNRLIEWS